MLDLQTKNKTKQNIKNITTLNPHISFGRCFIKKYLTLTSVCNKNASNRAICYISGKIIS
jgi:hypothetical protein